MIKKIITRTLLSIVGLVVIAGLVCFAQISKSKHVSIPSNATSVIRIDNYQIIKAVLPDWLSQSGNTTKSKKQTKPKIGLSIPFNIFAYSVPNTGFGVYYTRLQIRNQKDFSAYLSNNFSVENIWNMQFFSSKDKHIVICKDDEKVAIAFNILNADKNQIAHNLQLCLYQQLFVNIEKSPFKDVLDQNNIISFQSVGGYANLNYSQHEIILNGQLENKFFKPANFITAKSDSAILALNIAGFNANSVHLGSFVWNGQSVSIDSLVTFTNGNAALFWFNNLSQNVTTVAYETDENFNQVAVNKTIAKRVPNVWVVLGNENLQIANYLKQLQFIGNAAATTQPIENSVFPLFNLQYSVQNNNFIVNTVGTQVVELNTKSLEPFSLEVEFNNNLLMQIFPKEFNKYWIEFKHLQLHTHLVNNNAQISIQGKLTFAADSVSLLQVVNHIF